MQGSLLLLAQFCIATAATTGLQCYIESENVRTQWLLETAGDINKPTIVLVNDSTVSLIKGGDSTRTDITISIAREINYDIIIQIQRAMDDAEQWVVPFKKFNGLQFPVKLKISAQVPQDMLWLHKSIQPGINPCLLRRELSECQEIYEMEITMKARNKKSLELQVLNKQVVHPLVIELLSGVCSVACDGSPNNCKTNITSITWENPSEIIVIKDLLPSYYCARILTMSECCAISSNTLEIIITAGSELESFLITNTTTSLLYFSCPPVLIIALLVGTFLWKTRQRDSKNEVFKNEGLTRPILERNILDSIQILLLYPRKSNLFLGVMSSFRKVLEMYVSKVWDPLDSKQIETVSENPFQWLQSVLLTPNLKIISVQDASNYQELLTGWDSSLDPVYATAMSIIHNSAELSYDYTKLFNVRFNYQPMKPTDRVPNTRYELPQHLGDLICDILEICQTQQEPDSYAGDEILQFQNRLKEYTDEALTHH